jgi:hypothetical protein
MLRLNLVTNRWFVTKDTGTGWLERSATGSEHSTRLGCDPPNGPGYFADVDFQEAPSTTTCAQPDDWVYAAFSSSRRADGGNQGLNVGYLN